MSDDRPSSAAIDGRPSRSWLERLGQVFQHNEPQDRDELVALLRQVHSRELIDRDTLGMIEGVLSVNRMQARDIMIPRPQMVVVERDGSLEALLPTIVEAGHSRYPVIGENRDEVAGILLAKDLLPFVAQPGSGFNIREVLRPALFIPESKRLDSLLKEFRSSRNHMAIVVDEYGGVAGLITIEDILEQIVGEIEDEHDVGDDDDSWIVTLDSQRFAIAALTPIDEFNAHFQTQFPDDEFDTIGGLILNGFGHMPQLGEQIQIDDYTFTVLESDGRRLHRLEMSLPPTPLALARHDSDESSGHGDSSSRS